MMAGSYKRWPDWLKKEFKAMRGDTVSTSQLIKKHALHTVCQAANCPNRGECFSNNTATFMVMGDLCTRNCRFCNISTGKPGPLDEGELDRIVESIGIMGLDYIVVTSVTRDDLPLGGAEHFAVLAEKVKAAFPDSKLEFLIPDFQNKKEALELLAKAPFDLLNHNVETIERLYPMVRPQADFQRSLDVLSFFRNKSFVTKSGMMVGLGEKTRELREAMVRIHDSGVSILTLGQYLQPSLKHHPIDKYYTHEEFNSLRNTALEIGFKEVFAGPFVRSSYRAHETRLV